MFLIVKWFGDNVWEGLGIDHIGALMLPNLATAFGIFFLRQFFQTVPVELEEAARVDGTSGSGCCSRSCCRCRFRRCRRWPR